MCGRVCIRDLGCALVFQRSLIEISEYRPLPFDAARDKQGGFRQTIARIKGLAPEPTRFKPRHETIYRFGAYRLGAVEGHRPIMQVQLRYFIERSFPFAKIIGKIRPAANRPSKPGYRLKPSYRTLQKGDRRHENDAMPHIQRLQNAANQPHIVIWRQPDHSQAFSRILEALMN